MSQEKIEQLVKKGVQIPNPTAVLVSSDLNPDRVSGEDVVIYPGCKLIGSDTFIHSGTVLGYEAPVTVDNCFLGPDVQLKGGYFKNAVFLKGASIGSGAHVREGTILEEGASAAHTVGMKQTILFPFVTLGSLINFCDCFMAGGTSRKDHSEVGSSYIHFNYTPNQDKATPSLIGDVPNGVMMNQQPIFLGGQGGLVGPSRIQYGTIVAAGTVYRKDQLKPGRLVFEGNSSSGSIAYVPGYYRNISRIVKNNNLYIANLIALKHWYLNVRSLFVSNDFPQALLNGLLCVLNLSINERIGRFLSFIEKMPESLRIYKQLKKDGGPGKLLQQKKELYEKRDQVVATYSNAMDQHTYHNELDSFLEKIDKRLSATGNDYIAAVKSLSISDARAGTQWLQLIIDDITDKIAMVITSIY